MAFDQRKRLHAHLALGLAAVLFLATRAVWAETLFHASFDKTLKADMASGAPSPVGADTAVISVFTEITSGGKGVAKPGAADRGEALDLASKRGARATLSYESEGNINTSQGTIQCWVYPMFDLWPMRGKDAWRSFLDVRTSGGKSNGIRFGYRDWYYSGTNPTSPEIFFWIHDGKTHYAHWDLRKTTWEKGVWQHVMACWDKESVRLYVNGFLVRKDPFPESSPYRPTSPEGPITLGGTTSDADFPFLLDELRIDDRPLVDADVAKFSPWELPPVEKASVEAPYLPKLPCHRALKPPKVDGDLDDQVWKQAIWVSGFTSFDRDLHFVPVQSLLASCYDDEALYLAFVCPEPHVAQLPVPKRESDGPVCNDASIELYVCPQPAQPQLYFHFVCSAAGSRYDAKGKDSAWNGDWRTETKIAKEGWRLEMSIPWKTLGMGAPAIGSLLPFNAARNRFVAGGQPSSLAFVRDSLAATRRFGNIHFIQRPADLGPERQVNDVFMKAVTGQCEAAKKELGRQIADAIFLFDDQRLQGLRAKVAAWQEIGADTLAECIQSHAQVPDLRSDVQSGIDSARTDYSSRAMRSTGKDEIVLGRQCRFIISKKGGVLLGIIAGDGRVLASSTADKYTIESRDRNVVCVDEWSDKVDLGSLTAGQDKLEGLFTNSSLPGVVIKKTYTLGPGRVLSKRVEFQQAKGDARKVSGVSEVMLDERFRQGGIYSSFPSASGNPKELFLIPADEVPSGQRVPVRTWISTYGKGMILFTNKERDRGLAQYQTKINDRPAYPPCAFDMTYVTARGWSLSWFAGSLKQDDNATTSCETSYHVFDGDRIGFHREYGAALGLREMWQGWDPISWASRIHWYNAIAWAHEPQRWQQKWDDQVKALRATHEKIGRPGDVLVGLTRLTNRWGDLPVSDGSVIGYRADLTPESTHPVTHYAPRFQALQEDPLFKIGVYIWPWGLQTAVTDLPKRRPDWFIHDPKGRLHQEAVAQSDGTSVEHVPLFTDEYRSWWVAHSMKMVDYLKTKMFYTDGSIGKPELDWNTMRITAQADGLEFGKLLWAECRKRDVVYFANDAYCMTPFKDITFVESVETLMRWQDWRQTAEAFAAAKVYANPCVPQVMLYWPKNSPVQYLNTLVLLGFRASHPNSSVEAVDPYIQAAHEMYGYALVDVGLKPCYRREDTDTEAYSLQRQGDNGLLLTMLNHGNAPSDVDLSFDAQKAGLDGKAPLYVWFLDAKTLDEVKADPPLGLFVVQDLRDRASVAEGKVNISLKGVNPGVVKQVFVTNTPCLVWGIAGKPTQVRGTHILETCIRQAGKNLFEVSCQRESSILLVPPEGRAAKVILDGKAAPVQALSIGMTWAAVLDVPIGKHTIRIP